MLAAALVLSAVLQPADPASLKVLWTVPLKSHSFGGGAVADVNADGIADVAFCTYFGDSRVMVLSGKDGAKIWEYSDGDHCYDASCKFADVDGDGKLDLIAPCSSGCAVLCFDAATGAVKWKTFLGEGECIDTPPWIGDTDDDGRKDIVVGTFKGRLHVLCGKDGSIARKLQVVPDPADGKAFNAIQTCPLVLDVNGDGSKDFIAGVFSRREMDLGIYAVSGKDGSRLWRVPLTASVYHGPALGLDKATGKRLLTFGCYDGHVRQVDAATGTVLWDQPTADPYIMAPCVLADTDRNGTEEIMWTSSHFGGFHLTGKSLFTQTSTNNPYETINRGVSVADLNGDARPECALLTSLGRFRVVSEGRVLHEFDGSHLCGTNAPASDGAHGPVLADFNGDGLLDAFFVVSGGGAMGADGKRLEKYGAAVCLTGFTGKADHINGWYMFRHDSENSGNAATPLDPFLAKHIPVR